MQYGTLSQPDVRVGYAKTAIIVHAPIHSFRLFGVRICETCGERWGLNGCQTFKDAVTLLLTHAARTGKLPRLGANRHSDQPKRASRPAWFAGWRSRLRSRSLRHLGAGIYRSRTA